MPDLSTCMLHGSAAESSSSKSLSLLSASSFPVVSLHYQLSAPTTWFELLDRCAFDNAEREKRRLSAAVLVYFSFPFSRSRYDQRRSSRTYKLLEESIVRSSPLIESLKKMKCTDTSGDRYLWRLKQQRQYCLGERQTYGRGGHGRRTTERSLTPRSLNTANGPGTSWTTANHPSRTLATSPDEQRPQTHDGYPSLWNFTST